MATHDALLTYPDRLGLLCFAVILQDPQQTEASLPHFLLLTKLLNHVDLLSWTGSSLPCLRTGGKHATWSETMQNPMFLTLPGTLNDVKGPRLLPVGGMR